MSQTRVSRRYAEALLSAAEEQRKREVVAVDLRQIKSVVASSREFRLFLKSPVIKREKKRTIMESLFSDKIDPLTIRFLKLLAEKGREDVLAEIIGEYFSLEDERNGIMEVRVRSAVELSKEQATALQSRFEALTGKQIRIVQAKDGSLIGGVVARVGDTVFDGSIKRQLELLRDRFVRTPQNN
jgi:F-type H+-transporting ATPase subunit delta